VSRTVGLEHECPTHCGSIPSESCGSFPGYRWDKIHRSPLYKSMRRAQFPVYRPQDPFHQPDPHRDTYYLETSGDSVASLVQGDIEVCGLKGDSGSDSQNVMSLSMPAKVCSIAIFAW
jgi:hypothetical protein